MPWPCSRSSSSPGPGAAERGHLRVAGAGPLLLTFPIGLQGGRCSMNMLLDLSRLRGGAGRIDRHDPPDAFESTDQDFRVAVPVVFRAAVQKDREKVRIVGRLATELEVPCSRCLEPYRIAVDVPVDLLFLPLAVQAAGAPEDRQLGEDDANVSFYEDEAIDLGQVM